MKKSFMKFAVLAIAALPLVLTSCNGKEKTPEPKPDPTLSTDAAGSVITFNADGTGGQAVIAVTTNQEAWDHIHDAGENGWLTIERVDDTLELVASVNTSTDEPAPVTLTFTAGEAEKVVLTVKQLAAEPPKEVAYHFSFKVNDGEMVAVGLSENGRYLIGRPANEWDDGGFVFDLDEIEDSSYTPTTYDDEAYWDVDNTGTPHPASITSDGTTTISESGSVWDRLIPEVVIDGTATALPIPETYGTMTSSDIQGASPGAISANGKVITGHLAAGYDSFAAVAWVRNSAGEYEVSPVGEDLIDYSNGIRPVYPKTGLSVDGAYACGAVRGFGMRGDRIPYMHDFATGTTTKVPDQINGSGTAVSEDGTLFFVTPFPNEWYGSSDSVPFVFENGATKTFSEWVKAEYELDIDDKGTVIAISKDKKVVVWATTTGTLYTNHVIIVK